MSPPSLPTLQNNITDNADLNRPWHGFEVY